MCSLEILEKQFLPPPEIEQLHPSLVTISTELLSLHMHYNSWKSLPD